MLKRTKLLYPKSSPLEIKLYRIGFWVFIVLAFIYSVMGLQTISLCLSIIAILFTFQEDMNKKLDWIASSSE